MKKVLTKGVVLIFILSLVFSFAACGKKVDDTTTGVPTTTEQTITQPATTEPTTRPLSVEEIQVALGSVGDISWDNDYENLTDEQKQIITDYFADMDRVVEFRVDGAYFVVDSDQETTDPSEDPVDGVEGSGRKPRSVSKKPTVVVAKSVILNTKSIQIRPNDSFQLKATVSPSKTKDKKLVWKSSNNKVATVSSNGTVKAVAKGTAEITCTTSNGKTAVCTVNVTTGALLSYLYDTQGQFFYTEEDPWQRAFGFNSLYDHAAPLTVMYMSTRRAKFSYAGKDWMIQMWKGQYGWTFVGSEIGIYTKLPNQEEDAEHYDCASDADMLYMEMSLYRNDKFLFTRPYKKYWWITGFKPGKLRKLADNTELTMIARITLKDETMKNAFVRSLEKDCGFKKGYARVNTPDTYKTEGNTVYLSWRDLGMKSAPPTTKQPTTAVETTTIEPTTKTDD